ncbi:hypothetical protein [Burkholderia cenocepacia]|uniref:hypothetical protein n=1 Tax=Burkholderia cenocepacia TaxID=95486 RepID=UPI0007614DE1|nr:hypothetical protein [Burkholderia cenocepacia]KWU19081.1 hypothetical protein AS149_12605 [Burkholderia cenocepacia]
MSHTRKPSLDAVALDDDIYQHKAASKLFGVGQSLDSARFEQLVFEARLEHVKAALCELNPEHTLEVGACSTVDDLRLLLERPEIAVTNNAASLAASGGRFRLINEVTATSGGLSLNWGAAGTGFGQMHFYMSTADGKLHVDSECMGRQFIRSVLLRLADEVIIDGE